MYISHLKKKDSGYVVIKTKKKIDSAAGRLAYLDGLSLGSKQKAQVIQGAALEIFNNYKDRRSGCLGRFRNWKARVSARVFGGKDLRKEEFLKIEALYKKINQKCTDKIAEKEVTISSSESSSNSASGPFKNIKQKYRKNPEEELNRLRKSGILPPDIESRMDRTLQKNVLAKVFFARAMELREDHKETHFTLIHAQDTKWLVFTYLIKELVRDFYPKEELKDFKFLRYPEEALAHLAQMRSKEGVVAEYYDHNPEIRKELISCDAYFFNFQVGESAANFLLSNCSIASTHDNLVIQKRAAELISKIYPEEPKRQQALNDLVAKTIAKCSSQPLGTLQVILVPKTAVNEGPGAFLYRAHPFGKSCDCKKEDGDEAAILELLQQDLTEDLLEAIKCTWKGKQYVPQYRLLASHLRPGLDEPIYVKTLTPVKKEVRKQIKKDIRAILKNPAG